jgi:hypothetical protein
MSRRHTSLLPGGERPGTESATILPSSHLASAEKSPKVSILSINESPQS